MSDELTTFTDMIGQPICILDPVIYTANNRLHIGIVSSATPKMVDITTRGGYKRTTLKYPSDIVVIKNPAVTMYFLKLDS